jgi:hypothetical protein
MTPTGAGKTAVPRSAVVAALVSLVGAACTVGGVVGFDRPSNEFASGSSEDGGEDAGPRLDVLGACEAPSSLRCDGDETTPARVLELGCDPEHPVTMRYDGAPDAMFVHDETIGTGTYPVRAGSSMLVLSTGIASDLLKTPIEIIADPLCGATEYCPSTEFPGRDGASLPAPLTDQKVHETETCADDPSLVGTGDCSNTIADQWAFASQCVGQMICPQGAMNDYAELRMTAEVPPGAQGIEFDFAFMSVEYPEFYQTEFNDMFIAWVESAQWTGNVSFDEFGQPISLNATFLDYKDAPNPHDCPMGCDAPELEGFAIEGHAGTRWLSSSVALAPGESFELVFAVFDLTDGVYDSYVLLDNLRWGCGQVPPFTLPIP